MEFGKLGRRYLGVFSALLLLALFFVIGYKLIYSNSTTRIGLVPSSALMVYTTSSVESIVEKQDSSSIFLNFSRMAFYQKTLNQFKKLNEFSSDDTDVFSFLKSKNIQISIHKIGNDAFDFVFYIPVKDEKEIQNLKTWLAKISNSTPFEIVNRNYLNTNIAEVKNKKDKYSFSLIEESNNIIVSPSPILIEDVIRHRNQKEQSSFFESSKGQFEQLHNVNDDGDIYINMKSITDLYKIFLDNNFSLNGIAKNNFSKTTFLDVAIKDERILLNGFTISDNKSPSYLDIFINQEPQNINVSKLVPMSTALLYTYAVEDGFTLLENYKKYLKSSGDTTIGNKWYALSVEKQISIEKFYNLIGNNFAFGIQESTDPSNPDHIFYLQVREKDDAMDYLSKMAHKFSNSDSITFERYNRNEIYSMRYPEFPALVFGPNFTGFTETYFTNIDDYIIFGNTPRVLRELIKSVEDEDVWGKSIRQHQFLEETLQKSNVNIFFNTARYWRILETSLNNHWKEIFNHYGDQIKMFDRGAIQYAFLNDKFYTSAIIHHKKIGDTKPKNDRFIVKQETFFSKELISKPFVVKNHENNSFEVLTQNSAMEIALISNTAEVLWKKAIAKSEIVPELIQIDYYKNNKLQYLFADKSQLNLVDRNGQQIEGFPVDMTRSQNDIIEYLNVLDYDKNKDYRFILSNNKGQVIITDKTGKWLEGWNPLQLNRSLAEAPFHQRIQGKDMIFLIQKNGVVNLKKRNGENYPGFPVKLGENVSSSSFYFPGSDFKKSYINVITDEGKLYKINLLGKIVSEDQLIKTDKASKFKLISDGLNKTFIISRQDDQTLTFFNDKKKEIFTKRNFADNELDFQYYNFGADVTVFVVIDKTQSKTYLFDKKGDLYNNTPIETGKRIGLIYYDASDLFYIYKTDDKENTILTFEK